MAQSSRAMLGHLTSISERKRSPDILLKRWLKNQKLIAKKSDENAPLSVSYSSTIIKNNPN